MDNEIDTNKCEEVYKVIAKLRIYIKELQDMHADFKNNAELEKAITSLFALHIYPQYEVSQFKEDLYTGLENLVIFFNNLESFPALNSEDELKLLDVVTDITTCQDTLIQMTNQPTQGVS